MYVSASAHRKLTTLSKSKAYRDSYVSSHVRASIAYQIQALRERLGLSQEAFARKLGMKQSMVSRLENPDAGKVTVQTLLQIAAALDVALNVRFCSYPDFIEVSANISPEALAVDNIRQSMVAIQASNTQNVVPQARAAYSPIMVNQGSIGVQPTYRVLPNMGLSNIQLAGASV